MNSGQTCTSIERVYVEAPVYQPFVDKVVAKVRAIRQGKSDAEIELGSLTSEAQLKTIAAQVDAAVARGAKALTGGRRNPTLAGFYYEPTVLVDIDHSMTIMTEETFGPVIPIMKVSDTEEALRFANDSRYGLSSSLYAGDKIAAEKLAAQLQSGAVCINDSLVNFIIPDAPMSGRKDSGFGYRHGCRRYSQVLSSENYCHRPFRPQSGVSLVSRDQKRKNIKYAIYSTYFATQDGDTNGARSLASLGANSLNSPNDSTK
jgi:acyl-CoA reductase-like NAD-dependent aldehyde dehydrogenase